MKLNTDPVPPLNLLAAREFSQQQPFLQVAHSHAEAQLHLLWQGSARFQCAHQHWHLSPGRWCWIAPATPHQLQAHTSLTGAVLHIDAPGAIALNLSTGVYQSHALLEQLVRQAINLFEQPARLQRLLAVLAAELMAAKTDRWILNLPQQPTLQRLAQQILQQPHADYRLAQMAAQLSMSERSFSRHFLAQTGMNFSVWLKQARMLKASELLAQGLPLKLVAPQVGYQSLTSFSQAFREVSGESPANWQQQLLQQAG